MGNPAETLAEILAITAAIGSAIEVCG